MVAFYNQEDQDIYKTNKFAIGSLHRIKSLVEEEEKVTESFGITNTNAFTNSGGDNFNSSFSNNPYVAQPSGSFVTNRTIFKAGWQDLRNKYPAMNLIKKGIGMAIPGGNFLMGMVLLLTCHLLQLKTKHLLKCLLMYSSYLYLPILTFQFYLCSSTNSILV